MPVEFYIHTEMPDDMNERRAIMRVARLLHERYHHSPDLYILIANIEPEHDSAWRGERLTQLDGMLLGPGFIAILEFKSYYQPIIVQQLEDIWFTAGVRTAVQGGSSTNPFLQGRYARYRWLNYLRDNSHQIMNELRQADLDNAWQHLDVFLLFHPYLHPDSKIPPLEEAGYWFHVHSVDEVKALAYTTRSKLLTLLPEERRAVTTELLHAQPWHNMWRLLENRVGDLYVHEPGRLPARHVLRSFEEFTIGRSSLARGHQVNGRFRRVSGLHARVVTGKTQARIFDLNSTNGTYVANKKIEDETGVILSKGVRAFLGDNDLNACHVWFEPATWDGDPDERTYRTLTTE